MRRSWSYCVIVAPLVVAAHLVVPSTGHAAEPRPDVTAAELSALSDDIFAQLAEPNGLGVDLSYTGVDSNAGLVEVGVVNYTPERARRLARRFGADRVRIVPAQTFHTTVLVTQESDDRFVPPAPVQASDVGTQDNVGTCDGIYCIPTRGGVYLQQDQGERIYSCTSTIVGTSWNNRNATLSAGHCFDQNEPVYYGTIHLGVRFGFPLGHVNARQFTGSSDHAVIEWADSDGISGQDHLTNCIFVPGVDCVRVSFHAGTSEGTEITQRGVTTGRTTGRVVRTSVNADIVDENGIVHHLTDMVLTNACSLPGDSGGVVFQGNGLVGTISAGNFRDTDPPTCDPNPQTLVAKSLNAFLNLGFSPRFAP